MKLNRIVIAALALSATAAIAGGNKHTNAQTTSSEPSTTLAAQSSTSMGTHGSAATSGSAATNGSTSTSVTTSMSDSDTIRQAQQALNEKGFDVGSPDGHAGPKTAKALKKFQQAQGINPSGSLDGQTLAALGVQGGGSASAQSSGFGPASSATDTTTASPGTKAGQTANQAANPTARSGQ